jgi:hypothetical protein
MGDQIVRELEYILFCDESEKKGKYYSNFYGGLLIGASRFQSVNANLQAKKIELNLLGEVKWDKVTERYLEKYVELIHHFFDEMTAGSLKMRIMFRHNAATYHEVLGQHSQIDYFKLYYQFIKHAFGFSHIDSPDHAIHLRIYLDEISDTRERLTQFKGFIHALQYSHEFRERRICIRPEDITEVSSHDHVLLQCLDIVLGAIAFRLNEKHREIPAGRSRRGKRTIAKERLYKEILARIRAIRPNFNIGVSTGNDGDLRNRWHMPYRHWSFVPTDGQFDGTRTKRVKNKKTPSDLDIDSDA